MAQALYNELHKELEVFFFPRNQEELAGTDGLESMRAPFHTQSRLNVVLYRPQWGKTPWTGVEEVAIKESCLATFFKTIFFLVVEPTTELPAWLPDTHVRFNLANFPLDQATGAIKARVQERGGHFKPMTPTKKVALLQAEDEYQRDRRQMSSLEGMKRIQQNVELLFAEILEQLGPVNASRHLHIEHQSRGRFGEAEQCCLLGMSRLSMSVSWVQLYSNSLDDAGLFVCELNENAIVPPGYMRLLQPDRIKEEKYLPDVSRSREHVWRLENGKGRTIGTKPLAEKLVLQFLDLIKRDRAGEIPHKSRR